MVTENSELPWWARPWRNTSPTQIEAFSNCRRFWYLAWRVGPRPPQKPAQILGDQVHNELESYVKLDGKIRPSKHAHWVRRVADHYLPRPPFAGKVIAERQFMMPLPVDGAPPMKGKIDLTMRFSRRPGDPLEPIIPDYKTSKSIRDYGKKPEQLTTDVQCVSYCYETLHNPEVLVELGLEPEPSGIWTQLVYLQTQGPKIVYPTTPIRMSRDHVVEQFHLKVLQPTRDMLKLVQAAPRDPMDVEPNFSHCDAFGGCPYREQCGTDKGTPDFSTNDGWENETMSTEKPAPGSLAERMAAKKAALGGAPTTPTPAPTKTPEQHVETMAEDDALRAKGFTDAEIATLDEDDVKLALKGRLTPGMLRQPTAGDSDKGAPLAPPKAGQVPPRSPAQLAAEASVAASGGAKALCPKCKGSKYVKGPSPAGFLDCPMCKAKGIIEGPVADTGQVLPHDAPSRELQVGDVDIRGKKTYEGPTKLVTAPIEGKPTIVAEVSATHDEPADSVPTNDVETIDEVNAEGIDTRPAKRGRGRPRKGTSIADKMDTKAKALAQPTAAELEEARRAAGDVESTPEFEQAQAEARERGAANFERATAAEGSQERSIAEASAKLAAELSKGDVIAVDEKGVIPPITGDTPDDRESAERFKRAARQATAAGAICNVYIDCMPVRGRDTGDAIDAEEWAYPIIKAAEEKLGILNWRLKEYAHGKGHVVVALRKAAQEGLPPVLFVSSRSDVGQMVLEAIKPLKLNVSKAVF